MGPWARANQCCCKCLPSKPKLGKANADSTSLVDLFQQAWTNGCGNFTCFFYCLKDSEVGRDSPCNVLRSLLRQLAAIYKTDPVHEALVRLHQEAEGGTVLDEDQVTDAILQILNERQVTYIFIDALDECDQTHQYELLRSLTRITRECQSCVKICITSRDEPDIADQLDDSFSIAVNGPSARSGILKFIEHEVESTRHKRNCVSRLGEKDLSNLQTSLAERAGCM